MVRHTCPYPLAAWLLVACATPVNYDYASLPNPTTEPYRLQPGDVLHVRVFRNDNITGNYQVRPDGSISLPLAGEIAARGTTIAEVRAAIVERLKKYIEDAGGMTSVTLDQVRGIRYSVIGEVQRAGSFEVNHYVTLLEALANAGGLTAYAQPHALYVLRRQGGQQLRIPVSYTQTIKDSGRNFFLLSEDVVVVP
jgi:polysaccharide export outer membrane protein